MIAWRLRVLLGTLVLVAHPIRADDDAIERGQYLYTISGCDLCHSQNDDDDVVAEGGGLVHTKYGTFVGKNLTPDKNAGIGIWSEANFRDAMRSGTSPTGRPYAPAFPYPAYTRFTDDDLADLFHFLRALPPRQAPLNKPSIRNIAQNRWILRFWQWLYLNAGAYEPGRNRSVSWNRGAYLVNGPGHCGECHTPRNRFGGTRQRKFLTGSTDVETGNRIPSITSHPKRGIGGWSEAEIRDVLVDGIGPDGDIMGGLMGRYVRLSSSHLTDDDLRAIVEYLLGNGS